MAIDWRRRRPMLGNVMGGLSGPAIKPIALRAVYQAAQAVEYPAHRHRRHRHDRRRDGVSRRRGHGGSDRHGELLQSDRFDASARRAARGAGRTRRRVAWPRWSERSREDRDRRTDSPKHKIRASFTSRATTNRVPSMRVLSGIQPTGRFHWGNYFGAIRQYIDLQGQAEEAFYFIANLHALTTVRDPRKLLATDARRGHRPAGPGARSGRGHAVRAVRRARGERALLAADDRHADGPAGTLPRLQGQEGQGADGRRRPVHLSGAAWRPTSWPTTPTRCRSAKTRCSTSKSAATWPAASTIISARRS